MVSQKEFYLQCVENIEEEKRDWDGQAQEDQASIQGKGPVNKQRENALFLQPLVVGNGKG